MALSFHLLLDQARHVRHTQLIDASISLHSSSIDLLNFTAGELAPLMPAASAKTKYSFQCVIENTSSIAEQFPEIVDFLKVEDGKSISCPELGEVKIFHLQDTISLSVENVGSLWHSGNGQFIVLVDSKILAAPDGRRLNIQGLLNLLLGEVLRMTNRFLAHAGCTGKQGNCQLWTGESGSGKTTRTLDLVSKGFDFYGDDQVIIGRNETGDWFAWPFWRSVKVTQDSLALLPSLSLLPQETTASSEKTVINDIEKSLNTRKPQPGRIISINLIVPHRKNVHRELDLDEAFRRIAPGIMHALLPRSVVQAMDNVIDLLSSVPVKEVSWDMLDVA